MTDSVPLPHSDWGQASVSYDEIREFIAQRDILQSNEAQTRFDVIDRLIREVFSWPSGQVDVEVHAAGERKGYVDYLLKSGDEAIVIEAKKAGAAFPSPTRRKQLKLSGSVLSAAAIGEAIQQAQEYGDRKECRIIVVTNGLCWCAFSRQADYSEAYAHLFFPFEDIADAEALFNVLSLSQVELGSLATITHVLPRTENRLLSVVRDADARVDRNNIADFLIPALDNALYADALLQNTDALKKCFVTTEARAKFDSHLAMHLADIKSPLVTPAKRIKTGKSHGPLEKLVADGQPAAYAPPVTLIIGPVGAGKTTYLKHFEVVAGLDVLRKRKAHWVYVDMEALGRLGNPREFVYAKLLEYLGADHPDHNMDFQSLVAPAYKNEIERMSRGPLAPIRQNRELFQQKISEHITRDYDAVEPYVDRVFRHLAEKELCIIVLDNVDLYEDDILETTVFSEGLALSKRVLAHVIVSLRDTTYVKHKTDPTFDAFELRKLWLDPPPFKAVLSSRLSYSRAILKDKHVRVPLSNSMFLDIPNLADFFDIVQRSILQGHMGDHVAAFADTNIRKGLDLVTNFLTSGHIQADRAISSFLKRKTTYYFPRHEIFKGMMLGQWKHYKEGRAECLNLMDARMGSRRLSLLRLQICALLYGRAQNAETVETHIQECCQQLAALGASEGQITECISDLVKYRIVRSVRADKLGPASMLVLAPCGGYYCQHLSRTFEYAEACLLDTAIEDGDRWSELSDLTGRIERCGSIPDRMTLRVKRMECFMGYLTDVERDALPQFPTDSTLRVVDALFKDIMLDARTAEAKAHKYYRA